MVIFPVVFNLRCFCSWAVIGLDLSDVLIYFKIWSVRSWGVTLQHKVWAPPVGPHCKHCRRSSFIIFCHLRWAAHRQPPPPPHRKCGDLINGPCWWADCLKPSCFLCWNTSLMKSNERLGSSLFPHTSALLRLRSIKRLVFVSGRLVPTVCIRFTAIFSVFTASILTCHFQPTLAEIIAERFIWIRKHLQPPSSGIHSLGPLRHKLRGFTASLRKEPRLLVIFSSWLEAISTFQHTSQVRALLSFMNTDEIKTMTEHWRRTLKNCEASFLSTSLTNITKQAPDRQQFTLQLKL